MNRVLIINDSRFESIILSDLLSQIGYNVIVSDEYNAVKQVQAFVPDVVLVNYTMKEIKGDKLIDRIKASNDEVRCILTSSSNLTAKDVSSNVDFILRTPANRHNLEAAINAVERKKEAAAEEDTELKDLRERINRWKSKTGAEPEVKAAAVSREEAVYSTESAVEMPVEDPVSGIREEAVEAPEETIKFCPYCGHKFDENQPAEFAFCPFCGSKIKMNK